MASKKQDGSSNNSQNIKKEHVYTGGLREIFLLSFKFLKIVGLSLILCLILEYVFSFFGWFGDGFSAHSRAQLITFLEYCKNDEVSSTYLISPFKLIDLFLTYISQKTGYQLADLISSGSSNGLGEWINILIFSSTIFLIKLVYLICSFPLMILVWLCMIMDGLVIRSERIAKGTRDSGLKISFAKHLLGFAIVGLSMLYLIIPMSVHPVYLIIPLTLISGIGVRLAAANFMKFI